jgi:hypothetical protein
MKIRPLITTISILLCSAVCAQVPYTANDFAHLPAYTSYFQYGSNMGYYGPSWDDKSLADISAGNSSKNVKGAGIKSLRLFLPEDFLETWGYDIRIDAFNHYNTLGLSENVIALEQPSPAHTDPNAYGGCLDQSRMFKNLYAPIWDGGTNGTAFNDTNYFAAYVYKTVSRYKNKTRFWEIINEPDLDYVGHSEQQPGQAGNWWDNNPPPCELAALKAPIFHYIRMLRIAYDVIKTLDPTAYIAPGGLGHPSFLDAVLRNTDNPVDGTVTAQYPLKGGAYFDVMSFHSYPSYSLKSWDNAIMGFVYRRHSDAASDEYLAKMNSMKQVLVNRGYNGVTYPSKIFICTESNIGRIPFADAAGVPMLGSDLAQKNYNMKALVLSQKNDIVQFYSFVLGDTRYDNNADNELQVMGIYKNLEGIGPMSNGGIYNQQLNNEGIAYKTTSDLLRNRKYDATRTAALNLPSNIDGAAFKDALGTYAYVLWAKTTADLSEAAAATYTFPAAIFPPPQLVKYAWDYSVTGANTSVSSTNVALTGTPIFLFEDLLLVNLHDDSTIRNQPAEKDFNIVITPNPANTVASIDFTLKSPASVSIRIIDANGKCVGLPVQGTRFKSGTHKIQLPAVSRLGTGLYYVKFETAVTSVVKKLVIAR